MGRPSRVRVTGPLEPYASGFREELARQGYRPHAASNQLQLMAHAGRWLASRELGAGELTPARVDEFLEARRAEGYTLGCRPRRWRRSSRTCAASTWSRHRARVARPRRPRNWWSTTGPTWCTNGAWLRAPWRATCTWPGCSWPRAQLRARSISNA